MRVAVELLATSDLVFSNSAAQFNFTDPSGHFTATLENNPQAGPFSKRSIMAVLVFEVEDLSEAREKALDYFAIFQNALTFTTGAVISNVIPTKAFEWEPGLTQRQARYFATNETVIAREVLDADLVQTAERIAAMHSDDVSQSVLRWYRFGIRADLPEEQFSYFWFAVEIAAEALKEAGKIAPKCPICNSSLYCDTCGKIPERRRFSSEAIEDLIQSVAPPSANKDELCKTLFKIRNTLQHGRRIESIIESLPCSEEQAVNTLARIAWRAITKLADQDADPLPNEPLHLVQVEDVQNKTMILSANVVTALMGSDHDNPNMKNAPEIGMTMVVGDKNYTFDGVLVEDKP